MVGEAHKPFLLELLAGSDEMMVFASHLMRSRAFRDCVAPLEAAFQRCVDLQGRVFIVFAILSHLAPGSARLEIYRDFVRNNADTFRDTLKLFVEGVERDVMEFNVERLNMYGHRSKAVLYLLSLRDPHVHGVDPETVRAAVERFIAASRPDDYEAELAGAILKSVGPG